MYSGFVKCPNCDAPLDTENCVCPYCSSTAPMRAPWRLGSWWVFAALGIGALAIMAVDSIFGTGLWPQVVQVLTTK